MGLYRYMRSILMFDLPVLTATDRKNYRQFVKFLKHSGFIMFQESVYIKLSINESNVKAMEKVMKNHLPPKGFVTMLTVTEKQFQSMSFLVGEFKTDIICTDEKVIEL